MRYIQYIVLMLTILGMLTHAQTLERLFYSEYYISVEDAMEDGTQKQAVYSYILANANTPGVDLVGLLPDDDRAILERNLPLDDPEQRRAVIVEFVLAQMSKNNRRLGALTALWGSKAKSLKNVVTLGK